MFRRKSHKVCTGSLTRLHRVQAMQGDRNARTYKLELYTWVQLGEIVHAPSVEIVRCPYI